VQLELTCTFLWSTRIHRGAQPFDAIDLTIADAPRPREIVFALAVSTGAGCMRVWAASLPTGGSREGPKFVMLNLGDCHMKFVSYLKGDEPRFGLVRDDGVIDLWQRVGGSLPRFSRLHPLRPIGVASRKRCWPAQTGSLTMTT